MQSEQYWQQILTRDARQDGRFVFAVKSTGVYCRPSCPSRRPRRDSVEFFTTPNEAERAGYRACLRCKPTQVSEQAERVRRARQILDDAEGVVTLVQLSKRVGVSPFHLQRLFKRATGLSPREYQSAIRTQRVRHALREGKDVTTALYEAGFGSSSRLYENSDRQLGMTPGSYRMGGAKVAINYAISRTSLGCMVIAATTKGICAIRFGDSVTDLEAGLKKEFHAAELRRDNAALADYIRVVEQTIEGTETAIDLPLDVRATAFQQRVWNALRQIPSGETRSYTEVARAIGAPSAVRAVARACATNPVAIAVPCHRVVRGDGDLAGYRWGVARKDKLLQAERKSRVSARS